MSKKLRIIPLGGLGEVGKNMTAYEYGENILIVDTGIMFPENDMLGVDYIIPDFEYLRDKAHLVRGIVITHGHEDHIGAIHHVLREISAPVYGTPLTMGLVEVKLARNKMAGQGDLHTVQAGEMVQVGPFQVEFFHVCHSIPDSVGLGITSPAGLVVHMSDYKFDHTPVDGWPTDYAKLAEFSKRCVDLLLADSTNSTRPGWTPSEMVIGPALDKVFEEAPARIIVASFASQISRMQQVADAALKHDRKLAFVGMSMVDNSKLAIKMNYLDIPTNTLVSLEQALGMKAKDVVLMGTGSQGEPSSIIGRLATGTNRHFALKPDDTIVLSSHPIPGNEESVSRTINSLFRRGATVIDDSLLPIHVSGHASQEEMKLLLNLVRPNNFVPMHGELHMLKRHAMMAEEMGVSPENIQVVENGQVVELANGKLSLGERIPGGYVFVDGHSIGDVDHGVMRERERLAQSGIFLIDLNIDKFTGKLLHDPEIITRGFVSPEEAEELIPIAQKKVVDMIDGGLDDRQTIMNAIRSFLYNETKRKPMVFVTLSKV
ncbi:MAG: ribonuclease J [Anaerolineales bacterium]|uniref:Ribonuclease J n=1 Tax=Candidatus Desulfolinea nitratireducens TaxID=2841698 RepID=A0A8J6TGU7_9CHLR|nr:ribonuclease J [Candidatus Desulfolinea nitratireducens]MBL6961708.1 ribonuclease J [Anaerolineales bacterium]